MAGRFKSTGVGGEERAYDVARRSEDASGTSWWTHRVWCSKPCVNHSAQVMDYEGIERLLREADETFPRLRHLWLDGGYREGDKGADWLQKALGWSVEFVERPKKPAPKRC